VGGGGATDIIGRSAFVHKDADDFKTQPTGNSGADQREMTESGIIVPSY
jgi:Cu/Zn superoxide dismutase